MITYEMKETVLNAVVEKGGKKKLECQKAFEIALTHRMTLMDITRVCNENDIKISNCQLGCFK